jgi:metal-responsive CopG/Arc/MetJ family transcriptional regulator
MGRPSGKIQDRQFQMRVSDEFLKAIDKWRQKQDDKPSRAEAIRRLVQQALAARPNRVSARSHYQTPKA